MNAELIGTICVGKVSLSVLDDENIRAAVEGIGAVRVERILGDLDSVNLNGHPRALLLRQLDDEEERDGNCEYGCNENYISFFHLEIEREKRKCDHSCGEKRDGKSAEGRGNSFLVNGLVLDLGVNAHSNHKSETYTERGEKGLHIG